MYYRRVFCPGGTYFFTLVTYQRKKIFTHESTISLFQDVIRYVQKNHPYTMVAWVILPDHLHMIWTLPEGDSNYATRWRLIKSNFTHKMVDQSEPIWQRRYWEHLVRDEKDLARHIEYIHNNPVKHGYVNMTMKWQYSSFREFVREGVYPQEWGSNEILIENVQMDE